MQFFDMHSAAERVYIILFSLIVLAFGIVALNQYLNHLNAPAIALSMLVMGIAVAVVGWAWTLPVRKSRR